MVVVVELNNKFVKVKWMCGKIRHKKNRRLEITTLERVKVTSIVEKIVETSLRCFRHVERKHVDFVIRRVDQTESRKHTRDRGRFRIIIREAIKKDLWINELDRNEVYDEIILDCYC